MNDFDFDLSQADFNKQYNLSFNFYSSSHPDIKYSGFIDTILDFGVRIMAKGSPAKGHNIVFKIYKNKNVIMDGTGRIDSVAKSKDNSLYVVCVFNQFSEEDKKLLMKEAELNQTEINDYMDDLA